MDHNGVPLHPTTTTPSPPWLVRADSLTCGNAAYAEDMQKEREDNITGPLASMYTFHAVISLLGPIPRYMWLHAVDAAIWLYIYIVIGL